LRSTSVHEPPLILIPTRVCVPSRCAFRIRAASAHRLAVSGIARERLRPWCWASVDGPAQLTGGGGDHCRHREGAAYAGGFLETHKSELQCCRRPFLYPLQLPMVRRPRGLRIWWVGPSPYETHYIYMTYLTGRGVHISWATLPHPQKASKRHERLRETYIGASTHKSSPPGKIRHIYAVCV
jgi:hypothetical protein